MADTTREERRRRCGRVRGIAGLALYVGAALAAWTLGAAEIPAGTTRRFTEAATVDEALSGSGALEVNIPNAYAPVGDAKTGWSGVVALTADNGAWSGDMTILSGGVRVWDLIMADASDDLKIQFDVGHLAHAGERAADWFGRYPRRVVSIHAKDVCVPQAPLRPAPGAKGIDWPEMFALTQANAVGWYIVEAEANPSDTMKMKYGADFFRREAPFLG